MQQIRKLSIGADYKNNAMHYVVGTACLNNKFVIANIIKNEEEQNYDIYILQEKTLRLWKSFNFNMPISIEYNLNPEPNAIPNQLHSQTQE